MAVTEQSGAMTDPRECGNSREFVRDRLDESDEPLGAIQLCEEYGCTHGHMRDTLSYLTNEGVVERVARGRYALADDGDDPGESADTSVPDISDDGTADLPGEDTDKEGADDMPTQDEYRQQHRNSDEEQADRSASSEPTGSDENTSVSAGSDAPDDSGSDADAGAVEEAAPAALPMDPKTLGTILALALVLWLAFRAVGGDGDPEPEPDAEQTDDTAGMGGGLTP